VAKKATDAEFVFLLYQSSSFELLKIKFVGKGLSRQSPRKVLFLQEVGTK